MELMENKSSYEMYINYLGFNATQNCSSSVVSGAERNPLKYVLKYSNLENDMNSLEMKYSASREQKSLLLCRGAAYSLSDERR